jgi:cell division protein FtsA
MRNNTLIVGLDVGTTKICAVVGEVKDNSVDIIGIGTAPSKGLKKGVVVNIENTVESIRKAIKEAEATTGVDIKAVYVGVSGRHINSILSHGVIAVKEKEITQKEVDSVIDAAKAVAIPFDREILHVIPVGFIVDGENGISDPCGLRGVRLEANVQIITGAATSIQNLIRSCQKAGVEVLGTVLQPLAAAEATLGQDEKDLGVAVIDMGGGTTDIAIFNEGNICHTAVLALGSNNFTNDIAIGLRIPAPEAERIKKKYGCSMMSMVKEDEEIEIEYRSDRPSRKIPRRYLIEILHPRIEELFGLLREEIRSKGFHNIITSGVVLTGGAVLMEGMDVMAENILELPARIGNPVGIGSITNIIYNPIYATGVGLVLYGAKEMLKEQRFNNDNIVNGIMTKVKGWMREIFK